MLNLGCGRIILPSARPYHHRLVDESIYSHEQWLNVDRNKEDGVDKVMDVFAYPWDFADNSFDGALLSHIAEHCPHEPRLNIIPPYEWDGRFDWGKRVCELEKMQDGWYCMFSELYRVLEPGAIVHILSPYGWSQGAITDPTHTRLLTEHTFSHSMQPDPNSPFKYETGGIHFEMVGHSFSLMPHWSHLAVNAGDTPEWIADKQYRFQRAIETHLNVVYELYVQLRAVKA